MRCRRQTRVGVEPQKFVRCVSGFSKVDVGVRRKAIWTQDVRLAWMLHAHLRSNKCDTFALNLAPDLLFTGKVRMRFAKRHREDFDGDDALDRGEPVPAVKEAVGDVSPVPSRSWTCER